MLTRRHFIHMAGPTFLAPATLSSTGIQAKMLPPSQQSSDGQEVKMHVGTQRSCSSKMLQFYKRCGVNHVCGDPNEWTLQGLLDQLPLRDDASA